MTNSKKQKAEERFVFERFLECHPNVLGKNPKPEYGDMPDVIVPHNNRTIGIELTGLISHHEERELASIKETIWQETKRKVARSGTENLAARIIYSSLIGPQNPHYRVTSLKGNKKSEISDNLAEQITKEAKGLPEDGCIEFKPTKLPEVSKIFLHRHSLKTTEEHWWQVAESVWLMQEVDQLLQETINEKDKRYVEYSRKCDECWLVLHIENAKHGQGIHIDNETLEHVYSTCFDRVFYFNLTASDGFELTISR